MRTPSCQATPVIPPAPRTSAGTFHSSCLTCPADQPADRTSRQGVRRRGRPAAGVYATVPPTDAFGGPRVGVGGAGQAGPHPAAGRRPACRRAARGDQQRPARARTRLPSRRTSLPTSASRAGWRSAHTSSSRPRVGWPTRRGSGTVVAACRRRAVPRAARLPICPKRRATVAPLRPGVPDLGMFPLHGVAASPTRPRSPAALDCRLRLPATRRGASGCALELAGYLGRVRAALVAPEGSGRHRRCPRRPWRCWSRALQYPRPSGAALEDPGPGRGSA